ncbi:MAG: hypothetical protein HS115_11135 [Spirochaetales bacterium]|nr:hypothetical protein [Spirochaetales bacterium]
MILAAVRSLKPMGIFTLAFTAVGVLLLLYSKLTIETALVKREMDVLVRQQQEIIKKNQALKGAIASVSREVRIEELYRSKHGQKPAKNRVVRVELQKR